MSQTATELQSNNNGMSTHSNIGLQTKQHNNKQINK